MRSKTVLLILCLAALPALAGCLGRFAANQGRRQGARTSDHYVKKYVEPKIDEYYANDPETRRELRQAAREGRNEIADTVVRSGNPRQKNRVGVDDRGWLTEER